MNIVAKCIDTDLKGEFIKCNSFKMADSSIKLVRDSNYGLKLPTFQLSNAIILEILESTFDRM